MFCYNFLVCIYHFSKSSKMNAKKNVQIAFSDVMELVIFGKCTVYTEIEEERGKRRKPFKTLREVVYSIRMINLGMKQLLIFFWLLNCQIARELG